MRAVREYLQSHHQHGADRICFLCIWRGKWRRLSRSAFSLQPLDYEIMKSWSASSHFTLSHSISQQGVPRIFPRQLTCTAHLAPRDVRRIPRMSPCHRRSVFRHRYHHQCTNGENHVMSVDGVGPPERSASTLNRSYFLKIEPTLILRPWVTPQNHVIVLFHHHHQQSVSQSVVHGLPQLPYRTVTRAYL